MTFLKGNFDVFERLLSITKSLIIL